MTLPPVIRIFFALDLPVNTKEKIARFISELKKTSKTNAIRWSRPENLHITFQFLAKVNSQHVPQLLENVRKEVAGVNIDTTFSIKSLQLFPNPFRPRIIFLDLKPQEPLRDIAERIGRGIQATHYEIEEKPYRAHLTIGRIKHSHGVNLNFLNNSTLPEIENLQADEIVLFRSEPQMEGSKFTKLNAITLKKMEVEAL